MRKNLPVTLTETLLPENEFIYSRTDLKGMISEANEAFCAVSAYTRAEMIGQPHNMVRHPDMPEAAFADLWRDLQAGLPWRGIVKNRRKDGGFYWVVANVSPVRENGQVVGYQSVRSRPTADEIKLAATAYRRLNDGDKGLAIAHGRVVSTRRASLAALFSLRAQMLFIGVLVMLLGASIALAEFAGIALAASVARVLAPLAVFYGAYYLFAFVPRVNRDLETIDRWIKRVLSSGNLKIRLAVERVDLLGEIAAQVDVFVASVQATVQGMADTARQVETVTREVDAGMRAVHASAIKQSEATASAAAAVEEVTVSIGEVAEHACSTKGVATSAGEVSHEGARRSGEACATINALSETVRRSAQIGRAHV